MNTSPEVAATRTNASRTGLGRVGLSVRKIATGAAALVALALGYHVVSGANGLTAYQQKRLETESLNLQMQTLQAENERLKGHVDRLESDPNAIEHQAREELHYTRPGEVIYTMPAEPAPAPARR